MFQPVVRPRSLEERWAIEDAEYAAFEERQAAGVADPGVGVPVPGTPFEWAREEFERAIPAARRAEAALLVNLLAVHRAAEDETIAYSGTDSLEVNRDVDRAFRHEAAMSLDIGDNELTTLVWQLELAARWLPRTWSAFAGARLNRRALQTIVREMDGLDLDRYAADYDAAAVEAIERVRGTALRVRMHTVRERLQASTAVERKKKAEQQHGTSVEVLPDGLASWIITAPAAEVLAAEDLVERQAIDAAGKTGETRSIGQIKAALAIAAVFRGGAEPAPGVRRIVPTVTLTIPALTLLGRDDAPATLEGYGPIDIVTARLLAANAQSFARVLTDPVTGYPLGMDRRTRRISRAMRRWLRFRDTTCRFPGCNRTAARSDIDHAREWVADSGPTNEDNLAHLCRRHHGWKSRHIFHIQRDPDGTLTWTFPSGRTWTSPPAEPDTPAPRWLLDVLHDEPEPD